MSAKWIRTFLGAAAFVASGLTVAADNPSTLAGATIVTADQAKALIDKGTPVFDVRTANEFAEGHIKGAKNVAYKEKSAKVADFDASADSFDLAKLPADKNATLVLYCNGLDCWKSYKASVMAIKAGYKKIQWLRGGFPEWKGKGYAVE
jgi:rhodanese-related sulfurtransferase